MQLKVSFHLTRGRKWQPVRSWWASTKSWMKIEEEGFKMSVNILTCQKQVNFNFQIFKHTSKSKVWYLPEEGKQNPGVTNQVWDKEEHILSVGELTHQPIQLGHVSALVALTEFHVTGGKELERRWLIGQLNWLVGRRWRQETAAAPWGKTW